MWRHLQPVAQGLQRHTRLPPKILWGNAMRCVDGILSNARLLLREESAVVVDLERLLSRKTWPVASVPPVAASLLSRANLLFEEDRTVIHLRQRVDEQAQHLLGTRQLRRSPRDRGTEGHRALACVARQQIQPCRLHQSIDRHPFGRGT